MAYLSMNELRGMGQIAEIIGGLIGPLAEAGTVAYSTYSQEALAKKELKARQAEVGAALEQRRREEDARAKLAFEQAKIDAVRGQIRSYATAENVRIALAGVVLLGTVAVVFKAIQSRRKQQQKQNPRRRRRRGR